LCANGGSRPVALNSTDEENAGENLDTLLQRQAAGLGKTHQMCAGLLRNHSRGFEPIVRNCILHDRRMFVNVVDVKWTPEFGPEVKLDFAVDRWV